VFLLDFEIEVRLLILYVDLITHGSVLRCKDNILSHASIPA